MIIFKYRDLFATHNGMWAGLEETSIFIKLCSRTMYITKRSVDHSGCHRSKTQIITKYLKNFCEKDIIKPVADGHAGVNLSLVGKHSPGDSGKREGNEGWKNLKKEYEGRFNIKSTRKKKKLCPDVNILLRTEEGDEAFQEEHLE